MSNNTRFFLVFALILGISVAVGQIFYAFFSPTKNSADTATISIKPLPASMDKTILDRVQERADKFLFLTPEDFEAGKNVSVPTPTDNP